VGDGFLGRSFQKKMTKSDVADFLLVLEKDWAATWLSFFIKAMNLPDDEVSEVHAHMLALFVLTMSMPDNEVRDIMHDRFCPQMPLRDDFLHYLDMVYEKMHKVFVAYHERPGPALGDTVQSILNKAHGREVLIPDGDTSLRATVALMEQFKATIGALSEFKKRYKVEGLW
jgi:hypothetical protein